MSISRRRLLGSLGLGLGALPLVPLLERETHAQTDDLPKRVVLFFSPNGTIRDNWLPTGGTTDFTLSPILASLEPVQDQIVVIDGLRYNSGGAGNQHMAGPSKFSCGTGLLSGDEFGGGGNASSGWGGGTSIDQYHAQNVGGETPFASLELGVRVSGGNVRHRIAYSGPNMPIAPESNPTQVFDRLFEEFGASAAELERIREERRSALDVLKEQTEGLKAKISAADNQKMESHLDGLREIEKRLDLQAAGGEHCVVPDAPMVGDHMATDNYPAVTQLQMDLMSTAFACDLTRAATFVWSGSTSGQTFPWLGIGDGHHDLSHLGDNDTAAQQKLTDINTWYAEQFSYFVQSLAAIPEGDGTMLDNTIVLWGNELGKGNTHQHTQIPLVLAGGGNMGIQTGQFLQFEGNPGNNRLLVSILNALGYSDIETYGELDNGTGGLDGLMA